MADDARNIVVIGGISPQPADRRLFDYLIEQSGKERPKLGFVATASGDSRDSIEKFYSAFEGKSCDLSHLPLFGRTPDLDAYLGAQDVLLVAGGNTRSMLAVWREWGLPELLRRAWERGTLLAGWSAGAICWFEAGVTDAEADRLVALRCLGFLSGSCCPHYHDEKERRPAYHRLLTEGELPTGLAIDDGVAAHFRGTRLHRVVSARPDLAAYQVEFDAGAIREETLPATPLG